MPTAQETARLLGHRRQFVSIASTNLPPDKPQIILSIYGPRGGTLACETISLAEAGNLVTLLTKAIEELSK